MVIALFLNGINALAIAPPNPEHGVGLDSATQPADQGINSDWISSAPYKMRSMRTIASLGLKNIT